MKYFLRAKNIAKSELELTFSPSIFDTYKKTHHFGIIIRKKVDNLRHFYKSKFIFKYLEKFILILLIIQNSKYLKN